MYGGQGCGEDYLSQWSLVVSDEISENQPVASFSPLVLFEAITEGPWHEELNKMMLTCVACKKTFTKEDPVTIHLSHDGMYFFCTRQCKEDWLYPVKETLDSEVPVRRTEQGA